MIASRLWSVSKPIRALLAAVLGMLLIALAALAQHDDARAADASTITVQLSASADRSNARLLSGSTLGAKAFIFLAPAAGVDSVHFRIDGRDVPGRDAPVENDPPFDLAGTASGGTAKPFDVSRLAAGTHTVTADVRLGGGTTTQLTAQVRVGTVPTVRPTTATSTPRPTTSTTTTTTTPTTPPVSPSPSVTPTTTRPLGAVPGKLIFGLGPEADGAERSALASRARLGALTSWYNSPDNLAWMSGWSKDLVPRTYASGRALQLVTFTDGLETRVATKYGTACGRPYPLSDRYLADMRQLATIFKGTTSSPPLYVTAFTEFQTYGCVDNAWNPNQEVNNYYRALKDRYLETVAIFRSVAPNARVGLSWGGWQSRFDDAAHGGGRSMFGYFADVMRASDFTSFQAMQSDRNDEDILAMTRILAAYKPVYLSHYKPDNRSQATFEADVRALFTDSYMTQVRSAGLFALSFMDEENMGASTSALESVAAAVNRYGALPGR